MDLRTSRRIPKHFDLMTSGGLRMTVGFYAADSLQRQPMQPARYNVASTHVIAIVGQMPNAVGR